MPASARLSLAAPDAAPESFSSLFSPRPRLAARSREHASRIVIDRGTTRTTTPGRTASARRAARRRRRRVSRVPVPVPVPVSTAPSPSSSPSPSREDDDANDRVEGIVRVVDIARVERVGATMKIRPAVVIPRAVRAETARDAACDAACDDDDDETVTVDATARERAEGHRRARACRVDDDDRMRGFVSCAIISCFGRLIRILCVHASRDVFFRAVRIMSDARRTRVVVVVVLVVLVERLRRVVVLGRGHVVARRRVVRDARRLASARLASATFRLSTECILDVIVATARGGGRLVVGHRRGLVRWCRRLDVRVVRTRVGEMGRRARRDGVARRAGRRGQRSARARRRSGGFRAMVAVERERCRRSRRRWRRR